MYFYKYNNSRFIEERKMGNAENEKNYRVELEKQIEKIFGMEAAIIVNNYTAKTMDAELYTFIYIINSMKKWM